VDARLHHVQGKTGRVTDLVSLLQECYRDKLDELLRHQAGARLVAPYDFNNAYQYVIARDETQLSWLARAIAELGGAVPPSPPEPVRTAPKSEGWKSIVEEDARQAQAFVDKWSPRTAGMTHARHRRMIGVILGETLEQKRSFEQALAGMSELLGRRGDNVGARVGEVLPTRWIE
jgi:hypothetical protein